MHSLSIDDLSRYSPWPERLTSHSLFSREPRTETSLTREYQEEKYPALATFHREHPNSSFEEIRKEELGLTGTEPLAISKQGELFLAEKDEAYTERRAIFLNIMRRHIQSGDTIVDLGAGYGYNLQALKNSISNISVYGAEFSESARTLGKELSSNSIPFVSFNLFNKEWNFLHEVKGESLVLFSVHCIEMMDTAKPLVDRLVPYKDRIKTIIHFEPLYDRLDRSKQLDDLRAKYIEANKYNTDMYSSLAGDARVQIDEVIDDVFGLNPLFPESLLRWHFV